MAGATRKVTLTTLRDSDVRTLIEEHNKLVDDLETVRAGGAAAEDLLAGKIANNSGTVITATAG